MAVISVREYVDPDGRSYYARWFNRLNAQAAAKVATALVRLERGNLSGVKGVGGGVLEYRIDFGPGYRIYFLLIRETPLIDALRCLHPVPALSRR